MPTALVVVPHPDDESYAFGGLLALLADRGWRVVVRCASSGEQGERHDGGPRDAESLRVAREQELAASCRVLGAEPPAMWRLPDGGLARRSHEGGVLTLEALAEVRPELVLTLGEDGAYGHPDHLAVHQWVREAWSESPAGAKPVLLFAAFPKGLFLPQYEKCLAMMGDPPHPRREAIGSEHFDLEVDVRQVTERKLQSVAAHRTQLPGGDPHAIFPPGIIAALLERERYTAADEVSLERARALLADL